MYSSTVNASFKRMGAATLMSWLLLLLLSTTVSQRISPDPSWGFKALEQFTSGATPSINHLTSPAPEDLSRDTTRWIYWWPPSSQFLAYPLIRTGLTLKQAVRLIVLFCIVFGSLGWSIWISRFDLPLSWKIALAAGLPWMRYASRGLSEYSAEILVFSLAPWILLATALLAKQWASGRASRAAIAVTAILFALSYWIKYTLIFIPIGCVLYLTIQAVRSRKRRQLFGLAFVIGSLVFGVLSLNLLNWLLSKHLNPISTTFSPSFSWVDLFFAFSLFPIALAEFDFVLKLAFLNVTSHISSSPIWFGLISLPGVVWIIWSIAHRKRGHRETDLAAICALTAFCSMLTLFIASKANLYEARYIAAIGIALLPLCLQTLLQLGPGLKKVIFTMMAVFYVWLPLAGSVANIGAHAAKVYFFGLNPNASDVIPKNFGTIGNKDKIWLVTDPRHALEIKGRTITVVNQNLQTYRSSKPLSVSLILSPEIEQNGYGEKIRKSFPQATQWESRRLEGSPLIEWVSEIRISNKSKS